MPNPVLGMRATMMRCSQGHTQGSCLLSSVSSQLPFFKGSLVRKKTVSNPSSIVLQLGTWLWVGTYPGAGEWNEGESMQRKGKLRKGSDLIICVEYLMAAKITQGNTMYLMSHWSICPVSRNISLLGWTVNCEEETFCLEMAFLAQMLCLYLWNFVQ